MARAAAVITAKIRCAVYTRKSSDEGLDQAFNSLDAQREACEAYIKSQTGEGWTCLKTAYDDGGISGGTMSGRPCGACLPTSSAARSTAWLSTRSTGSPGRWVTSRASSTCSTARA